MATGITVTGTKRWRLRMLPIYAKLHGTAFSSKAQSRICNTKAILVALLPKKWMFSNDALYAITDNFKSDCEANGTYPWGTTTLNTVPSDRVLWSGNSKPTNSILFSVMKNVQWSRRLYAVLKIADNEHLSRYDWDRDWRIGYLHVCEMRVCRQKQRWRFDCRYGNDQSEWKWDWYETEF
jgi:hypothetical protein